MTASLECRCGGKEWATMGKEWASRQTSQGNILLGRLLLHLKPDLQNKTKLHFCKISQILHFSDYKWTQEKEHVRLDWKLSRISWRSWEGVNSSVHCEKREKEEKSWPELQIFAALQRDGEAFLTWLLLAPDYNGWAVNHLNYLSSSSFTVFSVFAPKGALCITFYITMRHHRSALHWRNF